MISLWPVSLLVACVVVSMTALRAQEIHILVLNGHTGKPINNECLNVWLDKSPGPGFLVAPANRDGIIVIHLDKNQVTADRASPPPRPCGRNVVLGPKFLWDDAETASFFVAGNMNLVCQEYREVVPGAPPGENLPDRRMPSYSVERILATGVTASNTCGKYRRTAHPGELIIFERPLHWWESMRR